MALLERGLPGQAFRTRLLEERWHGGNNATRCYKQRLDELVQPGMRILHAGCGWDKKGISAPYKDTCKVVGVDMDPRVADMYHSEFYLGSLASMPFDEDSFDLVFSEYVFEHLESVDPVFSEIQRVLKPGGHLLVVTPNLFSYKSIAAMLTPYRFHVWMGRIRYGGGHEADMYPTYFRCNTAAAFRRHAEAHGLAVVSIDAVTNGPTWFEKVPVAFELFHVFHWMIARFRLLAGLRCGLVVDLQKAAP